MSYGPIKVFSGSIASGASTCSMDLNKSWSKVTILYTSMSTQATISIHGAYDSASTYFPMLERVPNTTSIQYQPIEIATSVSQGLFPLDVGFQYIQFRTGAVVSGGVAFKAICVD